MRIVYVLTFIFAIAAKCSFAEIYESGYNEYCQDIMVEEASCEIPSTDKLILNEKESGIPGLSGEAGELFKLSLSKKEYLESYFHYWEDFYRFLRHKTSKEIPIKASVLFSELNQTLFKNLEKSIKDLKVIHEIENEIKKLKLISSDNLSYSSSVISNKEGMICTVGTDVCVKDKREENKKRLKYLERIRSVLVAKNSWWLEPNLMNDYSPSSEGDNMGDLNYSKSDLQFVVKSFGEKLSTTMRGISDLELLNNALLLGNIKGPKIEVSGLKNMTKDYNAIDGALNFLFSTEANIPVNKRLICSFALRKSQVNATEDKVIRLLLP